MEKIYNYVFHYNSYEELWYAIPRELYLEYWNNPKTKSVLKNENIDYLISQINSKKLKNNETE